MCEVTAESASEAIKSCGAEWDRLAALKVESTDFYRLDEKKKNEIIDAVFDLINCIIEAGQCES